MAFFVSGINIDKALNNIRPYSNNGWVSAPADKATGNPDIEFGCVTAVKALTGAPATASWRRGKKVKGNTTIVPGTAIATFARQGNGKFLFKGHAAIFCNHMDNGFMVYDQWRGMRFHQRPIYFKY
ncbi:MAG: BPSL0067 family protein, partial [Azoarcus sp.]|nr:BPSL0067 family protein [Azoarcus sp.]